MKPKHFCGLFLVYAAVISAILAITNLTSAVTTAVVQNAPTQRGHTVIIDPGHGGEDGGATSVAGILESGYNLEIGLRLRDLFHLMGYRTLMIRTEDKSVYTQGDSIAAKKVSDLKQRVKIVNETEDGILVSIHQNFFTDSRYSGAQVFYGTEGDSRELAEGLQAAFRATVNPGSKRNAKKADGIYLMERINCTGVLVECGFLSNYQEEAKLRSEDYQKKICCVIASVVGTFLTK